MSAHAGLPDYSAPITMAYAQSQTRIGFRVHAELPWLLLPTGVPSQIALDPVLAPVPNVKPWLRGVLNLRGNLVPVFDIAAACGLGLTDLKSATILVLQPGENPIGMVCIEPPRIALGRNAPAQPLPTAMQPLTDFLVHPTELDYGFGYEFRFREWTARFGRLLPGAA
jgi:CheW-like domain